MELIAQLDRDMADLSARMRLAGDQFEREGLRLEKRTAQMKANLAVLRGDASVFGETP